VYAKYKREWSPRVKSMTNYVSYRHVVSFHSWEVRGWRKLYFLHFHIWSTCIHYGQGNIMQQVFSVFATSSPSFHSKSYKLYMMPMQPCISSKIVLLKLSCTIYGIGWCSLTIPHLVVPTYIVAFLKHYPCNHHIFFIFHLTTPK
jgi:hypothetical protein